MAHASYTVGTELSPHTLRAHNQAVESDNKIHDDTVAAQYGFRGGLVPGVSVYAYMTYPLVQSFGLDWLARGMAQVSLAKPFYEDDQVTVSATVVAVSETEIRFDIRSTNVDGVACGVGTATLPAAAASPPAIAEVPVGPARAERIPVNWDVVVVGEPLPVLTEVINQADNETYSRTHSDNLTFYQGANGYVHPGWLLQRCNRIFSNRFILNPWIHIGSEITMYCPCRVGERLEVRGVIVDKFERKGHEFAVLDILILTDGEVAQRVKHTCIFRPRKARAA
jgi:acyl dehydratase